MRAPVALGHMIIVPILTRREPYRDLGVTYVDLHVHCCPGPDSLCTRSICPRARGRRPGLRRQGLRILTRIPKACCVIGHKLRHRNLPGLLNASFARLSCPAVKTVDRRLTSGETPCLLLDPTCNRLHATKHHHALGGVGSSHDELIIFGATVNRQFHIGVVVQPLPFR